MAVRSGELGAVRRDQAGQGEEERDGERAGDDDDLQPERADDVRTPSSASLEYAKLKVEKGAELARTIHEVKATNSTTVNPTPEIVASPALGLGIPSRGEIFDLPPPRSTGREKGLNTPSSCTSKDFR